MIFSMYYRSIYLILASLLFLPISGLPTVALVPGAWHSPIHYTELIAYLRHAGYETISQRNPSVAAIDPNVQTAALDAKAIRENVLMPLIDGGEDVVLVMHSYGGLPGATAGRGLSKTERSAAGKPGGIVGLIFISALVGKEGQSLLSSLPGQRFDPWVIPFVSILHFANHPSGVSSWSTKVLSNPEKTSSSVPLV